MSTMNFDQRLQRAIQRGQHMRGVRGRELAERELSAEEFKTIHSRCRLELTEHIEACLTRLADHFPGFRFQPVMSGDGWGARVSRDDLHVERGSGPVSLYSRLEMLVTPLGSAPIVELVAKGTIRNKEAFHRRNFQRLTQVDLDSFRELIDLWILEYAELYAASG